MPLHIAQMRRAICQRELILLTRSTYYLETKNFRQVSLSCKILTVLLRSSKKSVKKFLDPDFHRNRTVFTSETSHSSNNLIRLHRFLKSSSKFLRIPLSSNGIKPMALFTSWSGSQPESYQLSYLITPPKSSRFVGNSFELPCWQANKCTKTKT